MAELLQAAFRAVRAVEGRLLDDGRCLVVVARHFIETWKAEAEKRRTRSQRIRERDRHRCQVPGCSRRAMQAHHVIHRGRGGDHEDPNLSGLCAFHHLRGVHGGYLTVQGTAPDALVWRLRVGPLRGTPFAGGQEARRNRHVRCPTGAAKDGDPGLEDGALPPAGVRSAAGP